MALLMNHRVAFVVYGHSLSESDIITIPEGLFIEALVNLQFKLDITCVALFWRVGRDAIGVV